MWEDCSSDRRFTSLMKEGELMRAYRVLYTILNWWE